MENKKKEKELRKLKKIRKSRMNSFKCSKKEGRLNLKTKAKEAEGHLEVDQEVEDEAVEAEEITIMAATDKDTTMEETVKGGSKTANRTRNTLLMKWSTATLTDVWLAIARHTVFIRGRFALTEQAP